jgi:hypothetical protein
MERQHGKGSTRARRRPTQGGYWRDGREASVKLAPQKRGHTPTSGESCRVDASSIGAKQFRHIVDHITNEKDIIGATVANRDIPPATIGLQTGNGESFTFSHRVESTGSRLTGGSSAAAVHLENQRQSRTPVIFRRHKQPVGAIPPPGLDLAFLDSPCLGQIAGRLSRRTLRRRN